MSGGPALPMGDGLVGKAGAQGGAHERGHNLVVVSSIEVTAR